MKDATSQPDYDVPEHLRNAPTQLMKNLGYGAQYRYAHDEPNAFAAGENYFPPEIAATKYYYPSQRGAEKNYAEKLAWLEDQNKTSLIQRYKS